MALAYPSLAGHKRGRSIRAALPVVRGFWAWPGRAARTTPPHPCDNRRRSEGDQHDRDYGERYRSGTLVEPFAIAHKPDHQQAQPDDGER